MHRILLKISPPLSAVVMAQNGEELIFKYMYVQCTSNISPPPGPPIADTIALLFELFAV